MAKGQSYDNTFKREAVRLVETSGKSMRQINALWTSFRRIVASTAVRAFTRLSKIRGFIVGVNV
jgi:hypothetical protein